MTILIVTVRWKTNYVGCLFLFCCCKYVFVHVILYEDETKLAGQLILIKGNSATYVDGFV